MATRFESEQDKAASFIDAAINVEALIPAVTEWIGDHLDPGDVFSREQLEQWAVMNGYQKPTE